MKWQDLVMSVGGVLFVVSLLPSVLNKKTRIPLRTSLLTGLVLAAYVPAELALGLTFTAILSAVTAGTWGFLALKRRV